MISYEKSFDKEVKIDVLDVKESAGIDFLFFKNLPTSSADKCKESAAEPPFPQKIILFFFFY